MANECSANFISIKGIFKLFIDKEYFVFLFKIIFYKRNYLQIQNILINLIKKNKNIKESNIN